MPCSLWVFVSQTSIFNRNRKYCRSLEVDALPTLNAISKNTRQEFRAWQKGKVGGLGLVATLRAYFDTTALSERNPTPRLSLPLLLLQYNPLCCSSTLLSCLMLGQSIRGEVLNRGGLSVHSPLGRSLLGPFGLGEQENPAHSSTAWSLKIPGQGDHAEAAWRGLVLQAGFFIRTLAEQCVPWKKIPQSNIHVEWDRLYLNM